MSVKILDVKLKELVASDMYRHDWEEIYTNIDPETGREKFGKLLNECSGIITNTRAVYGNFVDTGYRLKVIRDEELYLYCAEKSAKGYSDFYRFVRDKFNMTILLIEHDMKLVSGICEKLTVLNFGEVLCQGSTSDVLNDPQVITAYLGE